MAHAVTPMEIFFKEQCIRCHGEKKSKGDLRLDTLSPDMSKPENFDIWKDVLDRLENGEMPPKDEPQPDATQVNVITTAISTHLDDAALKGRTEGRVTLRRLNRVEYENTVRDLFAVNVAVKEMLPEDTISHGFDNVGAALNVSPVLMERYLEAADAVLNAAVAPVNHLESKKEHFDLMDSLPSWFQTAVYPRDEGVVLFRSDSSATQLSKFRPTGPGKYRFRIAVSAHNCDGPVPMAVLLGNFNKVGGAANHGGYFDAPPGGPHVVEVEGRLEKGETIKVMPVSLPMVYLKRDNMGEYPGPGLHVHWIEAEGPLPETWPTESYSRVLGDADPKHGTLADAEKILRALLPRAFRRPTADREAKPYLALVSKALEAGQPFDLALRGGIKGVLTSPKFLYLREKPGALDDFALASRLSYFLWSTMPDDALLSLAAKGELHQPQVLHAQVERLLNDPRAKAFTEDFTGQWLNLRSIALNTPDKVLYPEFEELLQWSMEEETHAFFNAMLKENLSVKNIVDSNFAMINERLAKLYGIEGVKGVEIRKVALKPEDHRGGIITQASVLKVTANGTTTSPVLRGVWLMDRILGKPVPPPPASVPAIEPDIRGAVGIRDQLAKHRQSESCARCHRRIDPLGFALENYDVIGGWREHYRAMGTKEKVKNRVGPLAKYLAAWQYGEGLPVDAGDTFADGRKFTDVAEFKKLLLANPEQIARSLTEKLAAYATGHPVSFGDHAAINKILADTKKSDYGLRTLVHAVVTSELFLNK
jgi:Protein of unknown function (DUF1592)/Protein of unknown function (DUF1588)/Protein of unknown function (DUF1587)/Protein of unknown function (DUF1585)/Protein of unknown function (DUF1595)/Planctomycete cytochrome C